MPPFDERKRMVNRDPHDVGLCETCTHIKVMTSDRGSVFYRCLLSEKDPAFAKYPQLPVLRCSGWQRREVS
jgi:hypothetical protein